MQQNGGEGITLEKMFGWFETKKWTLYCFIRPSLDQGKQFSVKKEKIPIGGIKFSIFLKYLQAFGWLWVWLTVAIYLGQNLVGIGQNLWLSAWSKEAKLMNEFTEWKQIRNNKLNVYGLLGLIQGKERKSPAASLLSFWPKWFTDKHLGVILFQIGSMPWFSDILWQFKCICF